MELNPLEQKRATESLLAVSNATELTAAIVMKIVGNDVSDSLNGARLTSDTVRTLAQARFKRVLESQR